MSKYWVFVENGFSHSSDLYRCSDILLTDNNANGLISSTMKLDFIERQMLEKLNNCEKFL